MLKKRVITGLWAFALVLGAIWFDRPIPWFTVLIAAWGALAVLEVYRLNGVSRFPVLVVFGLVWTLAYSVSPHLDLPVLIPVLLTSAVMLSMVLLLAQPHGDGICTAWSWMLAGTLYTGWLMSFLVRLNLDAGKGWIVLALLVTFASDTLAFFVGRAIGRHRLAPRISPAKTWEGAFAGVAGAVLAAVILVALLSLTISYAQAALFGVVVSILGQIGGMVASLLKRNAGVKDSGSLLPGHGGVLDRTDSVIFAGVTAYVFFLAVQNGWLGWL